MYTDTIKLILACPERAAPEAASADLNGLFARLQSCARKNADEVESGIWDRWMSHPDPVAAEMLLVATEAIVSNHYDAAAAVLDELVEHHPEFAEAWHKRATLAYLQGRDKACVEDLQRTLELEPRHFGAMCHFAEICLAHGERDVAYFALDAALRLNPHLEEARNARKRLLKTQSRVLH